ncbi:MAG TPA: vWA domain-containing protein, partial [Thermomicrobiales bacterium]|nr:vWA domain-containing protein [Thermomicrobiales bacterium]
MNGLRALTFYWTGWSAALSLAVAALSAGLSFAAWRRSGYRRAVGALELLRLAFIIVVAVLFNQPEWVKEYRPEQKPAVVVLWDASRSMDTRDAVDSAQPSLKPRTRREAAAPLTDPAAWSSLAERMDVVIRPFAEQTPGSGTDLNAPLLQALENYDTLRAVVLVSDGDWNAGAPPVEAATRLRLKGVPAFAMTVGSPTRLPDVELASLDPPTFGVSGKSVRVAFSIDSSLPRDHLATVVLKASDGQRLTKEVKIAAHGRTTDWIAWKPETPGEYELSVEVPAHADELLADNNRLSTPISVRDEKLRVLIVESYPRWEYRYLRNALSRDPGVELSCLLFHPGLSKVGGGNKDYIQKFPEGLAELSQFDVAFLGDVGVGDGQLTEEQCRLLKGLVERQASGLVFMPGWQGRQLSLLDTELDDLYPVVLDRSQPAGWGSRTPDHFELTEKGRRSLLTKLADTQDENSAVWE